MLEFLSKCRDVELAQGRVVIDRVPLAGLPIQNTLLAATA